MELWDGGNMIRDIHYGYDTQRRLDTLIYNDGTFDRKTIFGYNSDRLPNVLQLPNNVDQSTQYSSFHRQGQITYDNATADDILGLGYVLDDVGRVDELWNAGMDTLRAFDFDAAGRVVLYEDSIQVGTNCTFDDDGGMECTDYSRSPRNHVHATDSYSYDLVGNRTDSNAQIQTGNRLTSFDGHTLGYDADGNLTSKSRTGLTQSLSWNSLGQLTRVVTNGDTTDFAYDAFGRRVRMDAATYTRHYVHDGAHVFGELNGSYGFVAAYAYRPGIDRPLLMNRGGSMYYYGTDMTGTVRGIIGADNVTYRYGPWGGIQYDDGGTLENPLRFAGAWRDSETYLYHMRARYYDPDLGRFISEDPIGIQGGINLYAYGANDPVNRRDPFGLDPCPDGWSHWTDGNGSEAHAGEGHVDEQDCSIPLDEHIVATVNRGGNYREGVGWGMVGGGVGGLVSLGVNAGADLGMRASRNPICRADVAQFGVDATLHVGGVGVVKGIASTNRLIETLIRGAEIPADVGRQFAANAALMPTWWATGVVTAGAGTTYTDPSVGVLVSSAKVVPLMSLVWEGAETIHSCYFVAEWY